ncbi:MAG: plasmid mobilization protein [Clostridium sp.]
MNKSRPKQFVVRSSEEEFKIIKEKVALSKMTQNEYLLRCCVDKEVNVIEGIKDVPIQLKKLTGELQQLKKQGVCTEEIEKISGEVGEIWQLLRQLIRKTQ